jgi:hypothetical protein
VAKYHIWSPRQTVTHLSIHHLDKIANTAHFVLGASKDNWRRFIHVARSRSPVVSASGHHAPDTLEIPTVTHNKVQENNLCPCSIKILTKRLQVASFIFVKGQELRSLGWRLESLSSRYWRYGSYRKVSSTFPGYNTNSLVVYDKSYVLAYYFFITTSLDVPTEGL